MRSISCFRHKAHAKLGATLTLRRFLTHFLFTYYFSDAFDVFFGNIILQTKNENNTCMFSKLNEIFIRFSNSSHSKVENNAITRIIILKYFNHFRHPFC